MVESFEKGLPKGWIGIWDTSRKGQLLWKMKTSSGAIVLISKVEVNGKSASIETVIPVEKTMQYEPEAICSVSVSQEKKISGIWRAHSGEKTISCPEGAGAHLILFQGITNNKVCKALGKANCSIHVIRECPKAALNYNGDWSKLSSLCQKTSGCRESGLCKVDGGAVFRNGVVCTPMSHDDCSKSSGCRKQGRCSFSTEGGVSCRVGTGADCRQSTECKEKNKCYLLKPSAEIWESYAYDYCMDRSQYRAAKRLVRQKKQEKARQRRLEAIKERREQREWAREERLEAMQRRKEKREAALTEEAEKIRTMIKDDNWKISKFVLVTMLLRKEQCARKYLNMVDHLSTRRNIRRAWRSTLGRKSAAVKRRAIQFKCGSLFPNTFYYKRCGIGSFHVSAKECVRVLSDNL